ncbi:MAG: hypothetical protein WB562_20450 [Candidatus Sulfotelmatobacter sp.]
MAIETKELDVTQEIPSPNGHVEAEEWLEFDDDMAFVRHISEQKPAEEVVLIPEWKMKVLCRALSAKDRIAVNMAAYDAEAKTTDYRRALFDVILYGCFNPKTGHKAFRESHRAMLTEKPEHGAAVERLFMTILRLSKMLPSTAEQARKN